MSYSDLLHAALTVLQDPTPVRDYRSLTLAAGNKVWSAPTTVGDAYALGAFWAGVAGRVTNVLGFYQYGSQLARESGAYQKLIDPRQIVAANKKIKTQLENLSKQYGVPSSLSRQYLNVYSTFNKKSEIVLAQKLKEEMKVPSFWDAFLDTARNPFKAKVPTWMIVGGVAGAGVALYVLISAIKLKTQATQTMLAIGQQAAKGKK